MHLILRTYLVIYTSGCIFAHFLHFSQNLFLEIVLPICERIEIILKFWVRYLIIGFISAIFWVVLLNGVVREVNFRLEVMDIEEIGGSADIAFLVPVGACHSVDIGHKEIVSYVEFAVVIKKWTIDIHLHYEGLFLWWLNLPIGFFLSHWLLDNMIELVNFINNCYSFALVRIFSRLDDPNVSGVWPSSVCWLLLYDSGSLCVKFCKAVILRIFESFSDMECQRNNIEHILTHFFIIILQVVKESLLVSKVEIVLKMIVDQRLSFVVAMMISFEKTVSFQTCEVFDDWYRLYFLSYFFSFQSIVGLFVVVSFFLQSFQP